jgi:hypothetical protein
VSNTLTRKETLRERHIIWHCLHVVCVGQYRRTGLMLSGGVDGGGGGDGQLPLAFARVSMVFYSLF